MKKNIFWVYFIVATPICNFCMEQTKPSTKKEEEYVENMISRLDANMQINILIVT